MVGTIGTESVVCVDVSVGAYMDEGVVVACVCGVGVDVGVGIGMGIGVVVGVYVVIVGVEGFAGDACGVTFGASSVAFGDCAVFNLVEFCVNALYPKMIRVVKTKSEMANITFTLFKPFRI